MVSEVPGFLITFREGLEAALIVAIVLAYLKKIGKTNLVRFVWIGVALAVILSLGVGAAIFVVYGGLSGISAGIFEGLASLGASAILTYMILWMAKNSKSIKNELERKIDVSITTGQLIGITSLAFVAVFREGIETVLFLTALFVFDFNGTIIGIASGVAVVAVLAGLMLKGTVRLPIKSFFKYTSIILIVFAAGLLGTGIHELIEVTERSGFQLGILAQSAFNMNPPEIANPLNEQGVLGSVFSALIGYDGNPEWLRVGAYLGYWIILGAYILKIYAPSFSTGLYKIFSSSKSFHNRKEV